MASPKSKPTPAARSHDGARPLTIAQRVAQLNRWRETYNPLRGLTISRAVQLTESYFRGDMTDLQWAYFFIEQTDPDLLALLELRLGRLLEMDYQILVADDADEAPAKAQQAFLKARFDAIDNLYDAIEHFALAPFRGFAHCEKWYEAGELTHLEIVDQWNVVRDGLRGEWKYNPEGRQVSFRALPDDALMPAENFLIREVRRPINRFALLKFVRSGLSEKDWDAYVEIYGIPGGVVIGPPAVPADKVEAYALEAQKIAEGGSGYIPNGGDWKPNTGARGNQPFKERLDHLSEKLVLAGTGGKLTMLTDATGLGSGASDKHGDVFDTIASAEARRISELFNSQLVEQWLDEAFPDQPHLAYFALTANEETDVSQIIADIKTLADAGFQIDPQEASTRTGYTLTLKPQPTLAPGPSPLATAPAITNRATAADAGREARFLAAAQAELSAADQAALKPAIERAAALLAIIDDDAAFEAGYRQFMADLPALEAQCLGDHASAPLETAFNEIIGGAMASGIATAAATRAAKPAKTPEGVSTPSSSGKTPQTKT